ncbi:MAG: formate dehydrogenase accessory sulfurtransferase FdhD [Akkermansiaceae bacterium]|nr:formate dehydrogenase accessory sulfurtransferase FdhD [Akkermansiaceae bacterium]MCP5550120.1 formate dehydrogenase accessory sulfurtransferase FdhD [Akkermansiaceae bacterium]
MTTAALLAGGRSTRMGADKAFLDWKGRPLYGFQLAKLFEAFPGRVALLSAAEGQEFPDFIENVRVVRDETAGLGPIGGLATCLGGCDAEFLAVLGVDLPEMPVDSLRELAATAEATGRGVVPKNANGFWEPLAAVYPAAVLELARRQIQTGDLSLQTLCDTAFAAGLIAPRPVAAEETALFANLNTRDDYEAIKQGLFDHSTLLSRYRRDAGFAEVRDRLAAEEPLEIRVGGRAVAVSMRTPGHDDELAAGFLFTEGVVTEPAQIFEIVRCPDTAPEAAGNVLDVRLAKGHEADLDSLTRHVFTSSSCGVCGKATIDAVFRSFPPVESDLTITPEILLSLPDKLRAAQETFEKTGGLHASALFDAEGRLECVREDVGRHNALDKVIGRALLDGSLPLRDRLLLVSGRISFELVQKALAAGIPAIAGISAPSSLAVRFAQQSGQTLVGFLRENGFNLYTGGERVQRREA